VSSSTIASTPGSTARHRSSEPVLTPFSGINLGSVPVPAVAGRSGLVLALSSGLVASMGLPASAEASEGQQTAVTASIPVVAPDAALASESVTASASATVRFEHAAFHPASSTVQARPMAASSRDITTISRSLAGSAYRADLRAESARRAAAAAHAASVARRAVHTTTTTTSAKATTSRTTSTKAATHSSSGRGASVVAIASRYLGIPYVYGGASPRGFDCSGLTMYVYAQLGVSLPRTAAAQYGATTRIARSQAVPGDLIFFFTGGSVTHVAIYLGGNMMLAAPHTGDVVKKQSIYSANIAFGRV
jgi:cell wall-associated NlpC family hydrolase